MHNGPVAYLNGAFVPEAEARLPVYDTGIVLGATVTEFIRTFNHRPFKLDKHVERLFRSVKYARFGMKTSSEEIVARTHELVEHNCRYLAPGDELGVVQFVTAGAVSTYAGSAAGVQDLVPTVCVHSFRVPFELFRGAFEEGIHAVTPSIRHVPPQCVDPKIKNRSRLHFFIGEREVKLMDEKAHTLLLDLDGNVTEFSGGNLLIVKGGTIVSPTERNILPGISRETVRELADELEIPFVDRDIQVYDLINADEVLETTTPYCVAPVTKVNGVQVSDGKMGPITRLLLETWSRKVDVDILTQVMGEGR